MLSADQGMAYEGIAEISACEILGF